MDSSWVSELQFVAIDLETTGLNPYRNEIVEIGAVGFTLDGLRDSFSILLKPISKMEAKARQIHQISNEEIEEHGVSPEEGLKRFLEFLPSGSWVFHNAPFDLAFLKQAFSKTKERWPERNYYDHLQLSRNFRPDRTSHSLAALKVDLEIDTGPAHRALADAQATAYAFIQLLHSMPEVFESKTKFQKIRRWQRKTQSYKILFPQNFDAIEKYFSGKIRQAMLIKAEFADKTGQIHRVLIKPLEIMIFSQNVYIRSTIHPGGQELLVPLRTGIFFDQELGQIQFSQYFGER